MHDSIFPTPPDPGARSVSQQSFTPDGQCFGCGYPLAGLAMDGRCPECGKPVVESLRGILLRYAHHGYVAMICKGLSLYLWGIIVSILVMFGGFAIMLVFSLSSPTGTLLSRRSLDLLLLGFGLIPTIMMLWGFWKYSEPDPGYLGVETHANARKIARIGTFGSAACALLQLMIRLAESAMPGGSSGNATPLVTLMLVITLAGLAFWAIQFFAGLRYTAWIARRLPDAAIESRAKTYVWLVPIIYVFGSLLVLGPLIATVMYWNLLDKVRQRLVAIERLAAVTL